MKRHLAIMDKVTAESILTGHKTLETRFSLKKIDPYGKVDSGDLVFIKISGGEIIGQFRVKKVFSYEGLEPSDIDKIFEDFGLKIASGDLKLDKNYHQKKRDSKYGTLIFITAAERLITSPIRYKKSDGRGWVVI